MSVNYNLSQGNFSVLKEFGIDVERAVRRANLTPVSDNQSIVELRTWEFFALWSAVEEQAVMKDWWYHAVKAVTAETCSPPIFAALASSNLREAVQRVGKYKRLIAPMTFDVTSGVDELAVSIDWPDGESPPESLVMFELFFVVQLAQIGTHRQISPLRIETPFASAKTQQQNDIFSFPVTQGRRHSVFFSRGDAELPFVSRSESLWAAFEPWLEAEISAIDAATPLSDRVRAVLRIALPVGQVSLESIAGRLNMSKRTLQRKLQIEGVSYQDVLRETRADMANFYRNNTAFSRDEIAFMLGYQDTKSLRRLAKAS